MERLTEHYGDRYIRIKGCNSFYPREERKSAPASNAVVRLAAYEDTELSPEEIMGLCEMDRRAKMADLLRLEEYQALGPVEELSALREAREEGRIHNGRCLECKYYEGLAVCSLIGDCGGTDSHCGWFEQSAEAEAALGGGGDGT